MHSERERATELGSPDPIHSSLLNTHASYNSAIEFLISKISETQASSSSSQNVKPLSFVVASHNRESIEKTMALMSKYQVKPKEGTVGFAQLMGMQVNITLDPWTQINEDRL